MTTSTLPNATPATQVKCACSNCLCVVDLATAIEHENQYYCSAACAEGHRGNSTGCGDPACNCCA